MPTSYSLMRRGGSACVTIACTGCGSEVDYASSSMLPTENRCNVVSYALRVAAFASGIGFAGYHKLFGRYLGMTVTSGTMFNRVIEEVYPHSIEMLERCVSWERMT